MEEKEKVCSEDVEQKDNAAAEEDSELSDKELEEAAGGKQYNPKIKLDRVFGA